MPILITVNLEAEFKEFELRLKYSFLDLSRCSIGTGYWLFSDAVQILKIRPESFELPAIFKITL